DRPLRRRDVSVPADDHARRRPDLRSVRPPVPAQYGFSWDPVIDRELRRALRFIAPYWRRLAVVLALSFVSTALSLALPLLTRDFFDRALIGRDLTTLVRVALLFAGVTLAGFIVNAVSGLRYTAVSADVLFDMRLEMYRHLQRLSP